MPWSQYKTITTLPGQRTIRVRYRGIAAEVQLDRDYYVDDCRMVGTNPELPDEITDAIRRCSHAGTSRLWVNGYTRDFLFIGMGPCYVDLYVPRELVDQAAAALTAADLEGDPSKLDQLADQMRPPFDEWLAPGARTLRRDVDFPSPPSHFLKVLRGEAHRRRVRLNGRADKGSVHVDPQLNPATVLTVKAFGIEQTAKRLGVTTDYLRLLVKDGLTTEQTARSMTKSERVAYLKAHGWTRIESQGSQTWHDPDETGTFTLAAAIRRALEATPAVGTSNPNGDPTA